MVLGLTVAAPDAKLYNLAMPTDLEQLQTQAEEILKRSQQTLDKSLLIKTRTAELAKKQRELRQQMGENFGRLIKSVQDFSSRR